MTSDKKTIQTKLDALNEAVAWFQGDDFQLEDASVRLRGAIELANDIEKELKSIENEIVDVQKSFQSDTDV